MFDCKKMHPKCKASCCGTVPIPNETWEKHKDKAIRPIEEVLEYEDCVIPVTTCRYCTFLDLDYSCSIYEDRPPVCGKYGDETHPMLVCPYLDKNGKERSRQAQRHEMRKINKEVNKLRLIYE